MTFAGILKSWFHALVTFSSGSKSSVLDPASAQGFSSPDSMLLQPSALAQSPQCWIPLQPKYSNLRRIQVWFNLQLTAQYQFLQTSEPCSPSTN
ncbi:hypothetical protein ATANTOWER_004054 [Ataeniobius toweri]|uniref:Uncharacterized protein n=1 Tax=Ataeniobius toweri TaxID=208326 RepID=A0ABU7ALZ3_9TELE|nr:hypothetical protein [Ataeniobius toweri]